jgi:hypothetical protein
VIVLDMGAQKPVHPAAEIAASGWPESEVEVVVYETVTEQREGIAGRGDAERLEQGLVIVIVGEDIGAVVTAVYCVVDQIVVGGARKTSHDAHVAAA